MSMEVGKIHATLGLDSGQFNSGLAKAQVAMAGTAKAMEKTGDATAKTTTKVKFLNAALATTGKAVKTLLLVMYAGTLAIAAFELSLVRLAMDHQKLWAEMTGADLNQTVWGKVQALINKVRDILTSIGYSLLPKIEAAVDGVSKALDYWPEVWAAVQIYMEFVEYYLGKIWDVIKAIWPYLQAIGKWFFGLDFGNLKDLAAYWRELADEIRRTYEANAWWRTKVNKENIEKLKKEAEAVFDIVKAEKDAAEAHAERRRQEVGWMDLRDLYRKAQVAAVRGSVSAAPSATLTPQNIPGTERLREIRDTLRKQETQNEEMLKIIRERLGVYA